MSNKLTYIYTLSDPITGLVRYVGKTVRMESRLWGHINDEKPSHKRNWIASLKAKGLSPIIEAIEIIENATSEQWSDSEKFWIESMRQFGFPLTNLTSGGDECDYWRGKKMPESNKLNMRIASKNMSPEKRARIHLASKLGRSTETARRNISLAQIGKKASEETKLRLSLAHQGMKRSPEAIAKFIKSATGKKRTPEQCARISAGRKGILHSEETRMNMSVARKGKKMPEGTGAKISLAKMGHTFSDEAKSKISETVKRRWAEGAFSKRKFSNPWENGRSRGLKGLKNLAIIPS